MSLKRIPSSVRVPVLSKQIVSIRPPTTIFGGLIQDIDFNLSLSSPKEIPIYKTAGKTGLTVIVTRSRSLTIISFIVKLDVNLGRRIRNPKTVMKLSAIINLIDSSKNLNLLGIG